MLYLLSSFVANWRKIGLFLEFYCYSLRDFRLLLSLYVRDVHAKKWRSAKHWRKEEEGGGERRKEGLTHTSREYHIGEEKKIASNFVLVYAKSPCLRVRVKGCLLFSQIVFRHCTRCFSSSSFSSDLLKGHFSLFSFFPPPPPPPQSSLPSCHCKFHNSTRPFHLCGMQLLLLLSFS